MRHRRRRQIALAAVAAVVAGISQAMPASSATSAGSFTGSPVSLDSREDVIKSVSARRAQSDQALLARTDSQIVNVMVKLDFDATASYQGGVAGLAATSPQVTGRKLTGKSDGEKAYERYTKTMIDGVTSDVAAKVPGAKIGRSLQRVYGGVAMQVPANQAKTLLALPNVAAVQTDSLNQPLTDSSNQFIGSPSVWAREGGQSLAGKGVIFADLDTGLWPEHPSVADNPALGTPPPAPSGAPRECNYGDNPLTPAVDVFQCNSKVIGGKPFLDAYNAIVGGEVYGDSARDSDGHGTHTTTTAAGDAVATAKIFGIERGPASGIAPGAWVIEYKVCGASGCFGSDTSAAVEQAIVDGVDVINYSISGGANPFADATELAFLDAYAAGVFVSASAGNSGPGAATTDHRSPWVTTVAASTQTREFQSTVTVVDGASTATFVGSSITKGIATATPVVLATSVGLPQRCDTTPTPAQALLIAGKIIACQRGGNDAGRVSKGFRLQAAGAAGMLLYNLPLADTETDNHFLPAVHLADGTALVAYLTAHPAATATFTDGVKAAGKGDVMAAFSSRGPGGQFIKPDITAPGVQILAGNTPTPDAVPAGPAGEYYQAIAGTSMSAPHIAGAAILLAALHRDWSPGAIKSALMTTAVTKVLKEDLVTPADPFDMGAGRVDLTKAGDAGLIFEDSAKNYFNLSPDPVAAVQLNLPSVNAPTMPGAITVTRVAKNVTGKDIEFRASATAPAGSRIKVSPDEGTVKAGRSVTFRITITSGAPTGQYFGQINITPKRGVALHLPVAFFNQQGAVTLTSSCAATTLKVDASTTCAVSVDNQSFAPATVSAETVVGDGLKLTGATGATVVKGTAKAGPVVLEGKKDATPSIAPGATPAGGFLDLAGIFAPNPVGDETILNFNVPGYVFAGRTFTRIGITSNGYIVAGGGTGADVDFNAQTLPDTARPNGVIAPFWSDLDGTGQDGVRIGTLTDGVSTWLVVQWNVRYFGGADASSDRVFQTWIGVNGTEDISFAYDALTTLGNGVPAGVGALTVGAENTSGTGGAQIAGVPTGDYVITSTPGAPGGSLAYTVNVKGDGRRTANVTTTMIADTVPGKTIVSVPVTVTR